MTFPCNSHQRMTCTSFHFIAVLVIEMWQWWNDRWCSRDRDDSVCGGSTGNTTLQRHLSTVPETKPWQQAFAWVEVKTVSYGTVTMATRQSMRCNQHQRQSNRYTLKFDLNFLSTTFVCLSACVPAYLLSSFFSASRAQDRVCGSHTHECIHARKERERRKEWN